MSLANQAVREINGDPCSIAPFGVAVVNTSSNELVCIAANRVGITGSERSWSSEFSKSWIESLLSSFYLLKDPTQHGEITGLDVCSDVLRAKGLSPQEMLAAWKSFSMCKCLAFFDDSGSMEGKLTDLFRRTIDTNGEPCPMVNYFSH